MQLALLWQKLILPQGSISLTMSSLIIERKLAISLIKSKRPCFGFKLVVGVVAEEMGWFGSLIADTALWVMEMPWKAYPNKLLLELHTGSSISGRSYTMTTTTQSMETPISPSPKTSLHALKLWVGTRSRWTTYIRTSNHSKTQYDVLIMRLADQHSSRHGDLSLSLCMLVYD